MKNLINQYPIFYPIAAAALAILFGFEYFNREVTRKSNAKKKYSKANPGLQHDIVEKIIRVGMTEEQVIDSWGTPSRRTVLQLENKTNVTLSFGWWRYATRVHFDDGRCTGWHLPG